MAGSRKMWRTRFETRHFRCATYRSSGKAASRSPRNEDGLHEFTQGERVRGFRAGDVLPGGVASFAVGAICPDETALHIATAEGALAIADGIVRDADGSLAFVPDELMGGEPGEVKRGLRSAYARLLDLEFDHLLFAHGAPWLGGGKAALRAFAVG